MAKGEVVPLHQKADDNYDKEFTKLLGDHILIAKGFYDYGIKHGLTSAEAFRFTIEAALLKKFNRNFGGRVKLGQLLAGKHY
jgi:hypothetical protein